MIPEKMDHAETRVCYGIYEILLQFQFLCHCDEGGIQWDSKTKVAEHLHVGIPC